jgi:hypothetical protein
MAQDMQRETHGVTPEEAIRKALGVSNNVGYTPRNEHGHNGLLRELREYSQLQQNKAYA